MENESSYAKDRVIAICNPSKDKVEVFEQQLKQHDLYFDFWIIAKWAVDSYLRQQELNEHKENDRQAVESFKGRVIATNRIKQIKAKTEGLTVKIGKLTPIITAHSPYDPNDKRKLDHDPINVLIDEMMVRLDQAGLSNHHRASEITCDFVLTFFGKHLWPESIRTNYLRFLRNSSKQ